MFINPTETIGIVIGAGVESTTGDIFGALMIVLLVVLALCFMFSIKLTYAAILILPLMLAYMSEYSDWIAPGSVLLIYLAIVLTDNFFFN